MLTQLAHLLLGQDPLATELLWDQMHRFQVHGRQGDAMIALSAVDCALWDIKGQALGQPIWRLLGGPTRTEMPAYASMLGLRGRGSRPGARAGPPVSGSWATRPRNGSSATGR